MDDLCIFELGAVVRGALGDTVARPSVEQRPSDEHWQSLNAMLPVQVTSIAALLTGDAQARTWQGAERAVDWTDALATAHAVADALGVTLVVAQGSDSAFHPGRCAQLRVGDAIVGVAGELHPRALEQLGLPARSCALELDFDLLIAAAAATRPAPSISPHPVVKEDLALVVADEVSAAAVEQAVKEGFGGLLESIRLFDVYRGQQIPDGSRSLAYALRLRAPDRTLEAGEIAAAREAALAHLRSTVGATLR